MAFSLLDAAFDVLDLYDEATEFKNGNEQTRKRQLKKWGWILGVTVAGFVVVAMIKVSFSVGPEPINEEQIRAEAKAEAIAEMQATGAIGDPCARDPFLDECK